MAGLDSPEFRQQVQAQKSRELAERERQAQKLAEAQARNAESHQGFRSMLDLCVEVAELAQGQVVPDVAIVKSSLGRGLIARLREEKTMAILERGWVLVPSQFGYHNRARGEVSTPDKVGYALTTTGALHQGMIVDAPHLSEGQAMDIGEQDAIQPDENLNAPPESVRNRDEQVKVVRTALAKFVAQHSLEH